MPRPAHHVVKRSARNSGHCPAESPGLPARRRSAPTPGSRSAGSEVSIPSPSPRGHLHPARIQRPDPTAATSSVSLIKSMASTGLHGQHDEAERRPCSSRQVEPEVPVHPPSSFLIQGWPSSRRVHHNTSKSPSAFCGHERGQRRHHHRVRPSHQERSYVARFIPSRGSPA